MIKKKPKARRSPKSVMKSLFWLLKETSLANSEIFKDPVFLAIEALINYELRAERENPSITTFSQKKLSEFEEMKPEIESDIEKQEPFRQSQM